MNDTITLILSREDEESERLIKEKYAKRAQGRQWVVKIDSSIIGGFVIVDGDYVIDSSISGQLNVIRRELSKE